MALPVTITGISTAVAPVGPFKVAAGSYILDAITTSAASLGGASISGTGSSTQVGQTFTNTTGSSLTIPCVDAALTKSGSPTDNVVCEIRATDPNGSLLATSDAVAASSITTDGRTALTRLTFASPPTIASSASFAVVFRRTGAGDTTNKISANLLTTADYSGGTNWVYNGSTWGSAASDLKIDIKRGVTLATDAYYFFGRDGTTATTLQAFKSTAPDTSWASVATKTGFTTAILNIAAYQVSNVIHMAVQDGTMSSSVATKYLSFDMATDTFLTTTETVLAASAITGQSTSGWGCSLVYRPTAGEVVIFYNSTQTNTSGTARARLGYKRRTGVNTYTAAVQVDPNTATESTAPIAVLGASDRVHLLFFNGTNTMQRHLTSANVLGTSASTGATTAVQDANRFDDAGTTRHVGYTAAQTIRWASADNPTVTAASMTTGTPVRATDDGTDIYALYQNSGDSDLYTKKSTDNGATFGSAVSAFVGTVTAAAANVSKNQTIYQRDSNVVIPYIVNDNGTLKYNEYTVRTVSLDAWNSGDKSARITLSNADKTATFGTGSGGAGVRSTTLQSKASGDKYYAEFKIDNLTSSSPYVGLLKSTETLTSVGSGGSFYVDPGAGNVVTNGSGGGINLGAFADGDVLSMAWDTTANLGWFRKNAGDWNAISTANPATGADGAGLSSLPSGNYGLWCTFFTTTGEAVTVRTEAAEFTQSAPSGFLSWMGETLGPVVNHYTLSALTGAVVLAGQSVKLARSHDFNATAGAIAFTGQNVTLTKSSPSLQALPGAFNLAGQSVTLRVDRKAIATAGAVVLSGKDIKLAYGHKLQATAGAVVLAGQSVDLRIARKMQAGAGALTVAVQSVILNYSKRMYVGTGAFVLAGVNVTLTQALSSTLTALPGAVVLSGQPVTLRYSRKLMVTAGTFALSGQDVRLGYGHKMLATAGTFALSGKNVTLFHARRLSTLVTTYALAGQNTTLRYAHKLVATPGAVVLTGQGVNLTDSGEGIVHYTMQPLTGTFALSGKQVGLRAATNMTPTIGVVTLAGQSVTLRYGHKTQAATGVFTLAGQTVALRRNRNIAVTAGTFALSGNNVTLRYAHKTQAGAGAFVLSGQSVNLTYGAGYKLFPLPGGIVLAGPPILLTRGRGVIAGTGTIVLNGVTTGTLRSYRLGAGTGDLYFSRFPAGVQGPTVQPGPLRFGHARVYLKRW